MLDCSPVAKKRTRYDSYLIEKADNLSANFLKSLGACHLETDYNASERTNARHFQDLVTRLKEKFHSAETDRAHKLQILTLFPYEWSADKIANIMETTKHMATVSKQLVEQKGLLSLPEPKKDQTDGTDWKDFDDRALATHDAPYKVTSNEIMPSRHLWDDHLDGPISDEEDENMHTDEDVEEEEEEEEEVRINIEEDVEDQVEDDNDVDEGIELTTTVKMPVPPCLQASRNLKNCQAKQCGKGWSSAQIKRKQEGQMYETDMSLFGDDTTENIQLLDEEVVECADDSGIGLEFIDNNVESC
ncbi:hypothetical protein HCN44_010406 [Aphidius gifuensis]|uniref:Uncharacterized protein n=1 Tax=Aphidius gifuensis TaxID=684658 RepID=A0A834Y745_APHGI|nr:hypothetical protein HCN44_010406 [Aphidius gifuensis]